MEKRAGCMQCPWSVISVGKWLESQEQNQRTSQCQQWLMRLKLFMARDLVLVWKQLKEAENFLIQRGNHIPKRTLESNSIDCLGAWRKMRHGNGHCDLAEFCLFVGLLKEWLACDSKNFPKPVQVFAVQISIGWFPKIKNSVVWKHNSC